MSRVIEAVTIGCRVPGKFRGTVHSVFHSAANLTVEGLDHQLTLIVSDSIDLPQGIRLLDGETDAIQTLAPGMEMLCQDGLLVPTEYRYKIALHQAQRYDGEIVRQSGGTAAERAMIPSYQAAWELLASQQAVKQSDLRILDLPHMLRGAASPETRKQKVIRHLVELMQATRHLDLALAAAAMRSLVGLGGGLTPTGDDVLVGFLAGLRASSGVETIRIEWLSHLGKVLRVASTRTNDISRSYLTLAAGGQFSSSLKNFALAVCSGEPADKVYKAAEIAFQVGHTSGMDAATGLLAGLAAWQDRLIPVLPSEEE